MLGSCGMEGLGDTQSLDTTYNAISASGAAVAAACAVCAPVAGLIAAAAQIAKALKIGYGCGPTCIQATQIVNSAESTFNQNVDEYESGGIDQATAINNWNGMWGAIQQACGAIPGAAGIDCVSDRAAGSCKWKQTAVGASKGYPGVPKEGECWNWDLGYHQPLLLPALVPYGGGVTGSLNSVADSVVSSLTSNPMLMVGVGLLLVGLMSKGGKN
jgi:hypothetical protein